MCQLATCGRWAVVSSIYISLSHLHLTHPSTSYSSIYISLNNIRGKYNLVYEDMKSCPVPPSYFPSHSHRPPCGRARYPKRIEPLNSNETQSRCILIRTPCRAQPPKYDIEMSRATVTSSRKRCPCFPTQFSIMSMSYFGGCALHGVRIMMQRESCIMSPLLTDKVLHHVALELVAFGMSLSK